MRVVVVLSVAVLAVAALVSLNGSQENVVSQPSQMDAVVAPLANPAPATYTQPYWDLAAEWAERNAAAKASAAPRPGDAYYTVRYWDLAAEWAERNAAAKASAAPRPQDAYYTERYWDEAAESAENALPLVNSAPEVKAIPESYTQQYWDLADEWARRHDPMTNGAPRPEDATYTERYWKMNE